MNTTQTDSRILFFLQKISVPFARCALFVVYFWFGLLKVIGMSPASDMVKHLLTITMPFMPFTTFIILFGLFEMLIGILFLFPRFERVAFGLFVLHMITTFLPLFFMSEVWSTTLVPTLEGQYIIKNLALIGCALSIVTKMRPVETRTY